MATYTGTSGNDVRNGSLVEANEFFSFGIGADTLRGGVLRDVFHLSADAATDSIDGAAGRDMVDYGASSRALTIALGEGTQNGSVTARFLQGFVQDSFGTRPVYETRTVATLRSIEDVVGSQWGDRITGNSTVNLLDGGAGDDIIDGGDGSDTLIGGAGKDTLIGGAGVDTVSYAQAGVGMNIRLSDALFSSPGSPSLIGRAWQITANGLVEEDSISQAENVIGSAHDDVIRGNHELNRLDGGAGDDVIETRIDGHNDQIIGGADIDTVDYSGYSQTNMLRIVLGEDGAAGQTSYYQWSPNGSTLIVEDTLTGIENVVGGNGNDMIIGNSEANVLAGGGGLDGFFGGDGADTLVGNATRDNLFYSSLDGARDVIQGGSGVDRVFYDHNMAPSDHGVTVRLADGDAMGTATARYVDSFFNPSTGQMTQISRLVTEDELYRVEDVDGSGGNDDIRGNGVDNVLGGKGGNDVIDGAGGADELYGGAGRDTLIGGAGEDMFVFTSGSDSTLAQRDSISDFVRGQDKIDLHLMWDDAADDQPLNFVSGGFTGEAGQVRAVFTGLQTGWRVSADLDGNAVADFEFFVDSATTTETLRPLQASDFLFDL